MSDTLAIDIDDVLAANAAGFVAFSNERWGTNLTVDDYDEHWSNVWNISEAETAKRATELHESGAIGNYRHFPEAESVLRELSDTFRIIAVTSRRKMIEPETRAWIETHFMGVIDDIRFAGFYDEDDTHSKHVDVRRAETKTDILKEINAKYFIDDQLKHCLSAVSAGIEVVLFGDYSWNQISSLPENVTRCASWDDVAQYFR